MKCMTPSKRELTTTLTLGHYGEEPEWEETVEVTGLVDLRDDDMVDVILVDMPVGRGFGAYSDKHLAQMEEALMDAAVKADERERRVQPSPFMFAAAGGAR